MLLRRIRSLLIKTVSNKIYAEMSLWYFKLWNSHRVLIPNLHSTIEKSEVIKIMIIIEWWLLECWLFPALSSFDHWKYSFIHSTTKKARVTPCETLLWVWSECSVQKVCSLKRNQSSEESEVLVHHCQFLKLCRVSSCLHEEEKPRGSQIL